MLGSSIHSSHLQHIFPRLDHGGKYSNSMYRTLAKFVDFFPGFSVAVIFLQSITKNRMSRILCPMPKSLDPMYIISYYISHKLLLSINL